jgi:hypothetical protein
MGLQPPFAEPFEIGCQAHDVVLARPCHGDVGVVCRTTARRELPHLRQRQPDGSVAPGVPTERPLLRALVKLGVLAGGGLTPSRIRALAAVRA